MKHGWQFNQQNDPNEFQLSNLDEVNEEPYKLPSIYFENVVKYVMTGKKLDLGYNQQNQSKSSMTFKPKGNSDNQ